MAAIDKIIKSYHNDVRAKPEFIKPDSENQKTILNDLAAGRENMYRIFVEIRSLKNNLHCRIKFLILQSKK